MAILDSMKNERFTKIPYDELSQWEVGKAVIKDAVNRWEVIGFLDGITNNTKKEMLAVAYDNITIDILTENERVINIAKRYDLNCSIEGDDFNFSTLIYPVLRRVVCGVVGKSDGAKGFSYEKFLDYLEYFSFLAINEYGYEKYADKDGETWSVPIDAEFCSILASIIEDKFESEKN